MVTANSYQSLIPTKKNNRAIEYCILKKRIDTCCINLSYNKRALVDVFNGCLFFAFSSHQLQRQHIASRLVIGNNLYSMMVINALGDFVTFYGEREHHSNLYRWYLLQNISHYSSHKKTFIQIDWFGNTSDYNLSHP